MANVNGTIYAISQVTGTAAPSNWQTAGYVNGREKCMLDFYVAAGTEAAGTVLYMGNPLPVGAKILIVNMLSNANTAGLTTSVGDLALATRYANADTSMQTLRVAAFSGLIDSTNGWYVIGTNPGTGANAALTGDAQLIVTTGGATLGAGTIYGIRCIFVTD